MSLYDGLSVETAPIPEINPQILGSDSSNATTGNLSKFTHVHTLLIQEFVSTTLHSTHKLMKITTLVICVPWGVLCVRVCVCACMHVCVCMCVCTCMQSLLTIIFVHPY